MSCLIINERVGDAFIDALLPSIYSSILILGAALYKVSLFALLFPLCAIIFMVNYRTLVYRPARKAHEERRILLMKRQLSGDFNCREVQSRRQMHQQSRSSQSKVSDSFAGRIQRLLIILMYGIISGITHISDKNVKKDIAKKIAYQKLWCLMNQPASHQGAASLSGGKGHQSDVLAENEFNDKSFASKRNYTMQKIKTGSTSSEITRILTSSRVWREASYGSPYTSFFIGIGKPQMQVHSKDDLVVTKLLERGESFRELRPVIIFDTGEALLRIWSKLSTAAVQNDGADDELWKDPFEVPVEDLFEEFENVFDVFYIDGIPMSETEGEEACEFFSKWITVQNPPFKARSSGEVRLNIQMVGFKAFHS